MESDGVKQANCIVRNKHINDSNFIMERKHWCSFCLIPFNNELRLSDHLLKIHPKQPLVFCRLCMLTFVNCSQLEYHVRYKHSDLFINKFVENNENICRKKIIELETEIESDSKLTDSSEEENSITKSEEGDFFEKTNDMVGTDSESVEEPVENNSSYMKYISAQNVCSSDDENHASELDLKGVNTNQMNNSHDQYFNVINCDVSCPVRLEWEKTRRHDASFTRNIHNLEDTLSTSKRLLNLQHMKSAFLTSDNIVYTQRPSFKSNDEDEGQEYLREEYPHEKTQVHTKEIVQQIQRVGSDRKNEDILDYGKNKAILSQHDVQDGDELVGANTEHELAVADEVYSPGQPVWKKAINILKDTFMKKKKRTRKKGMFASTNTVTFSKWLPDNFPVEGVMCGCGRHFKTPTSLLGHLRRKSATARKSLKLLKKKCIIKAFKDVT